MTETELIEVHDTDGELIGRYKQDDEMIYVFRPNGEALKPTQRSDNPEALARIILSEPK